MDLGPNRLYADCVLEAKAGCDDETIRNSTRLAAGPVVDSLAAKHEIGVGILGKDVRKNDGTDRSDCPAVGAHFVVISVGPHIDIPVVGFLLEREPGGDRDDCLKKDRNLERPLETDRDAVRGVDDDHTLESKPDFTV